MWNTSEYQIAGFSDIIIIIIVNERKISYKNLKKHNKSRRILAFLANNYCDEINGNEEYGIILKDDTFSINLYI